MEKDFLNNFINKMQMDEELLKKFVQAIGGGNSAVYHNVVSEAITLADDWIFTLDGALFSVEKIVKNPRKFIAEEDLLVAVERARKTNANTIRHLASNSQYVQNISRDGEVRPKKVLTTEMREDLAIYENRFVCTLIQRLVPFVEQRYRDIVGKMRMYEQTSVGINSKFRYGKSDVECKVEVTVREPSHDLVLLEKNKELLEKITQIRRRLKVLQNTDFMRQLSGKKPVHAPIIKTNLIKMNVDYQNCYKLWLYVSSYTFVGFSAKFDTKDLPVDGDYYDDLTVLAGLSVQSLISNQTLNREEYDAIPFNESKKKNYKIIKEYKFEPTFEADKKAASDDVVNEYYFKRMRNELVRATTRTSVTQEKDASMSFSRFVRSIAKINGEMYADIIRSQEEKEKISKRKTPLEKKEKSVQNQKILLQRYRQLSKLKKEEYEKTLKAEAREAQKLEKMQAEFEKERKKDLAEKKKKERTTKQRAEKLKKSVAKEERGDEE